MPFKVPRYDYPAQFSCEHDLLAAIRSLLLDGGYILGPQVTAFEEEFARYIGGGTAVVGVNSGTDALVLALDALGVGPGDVVITAANTFHGTALAIRRVGATPALVDCDPRTYLMDIGQLSSCLTERTRAVLPVHLYGQALDMTQLRQIADARGLLLVEDCAQAVGARSGGASVGTLGDAGCWSFAPSKNLAAAGDGGAVTVRDHALADRLRLLRHFGQHQQNEHELPGYNSRLDAIQALVLSHKLPRLDEWNASRLAIAARYREALAGLPLSFQEGARSGEHVYHLFQVRTGSRQERDRILSFLRESSVDAVIRYPHPIHLQNAFRDLGYQPGQFPVAEALAAETLCLPLFPSMDLSSVDYVL